MGVDADCTVIVGVGVGRGKEMAVSESGEGSARRMKGCREIEVSMLSPFCHVSSFRDFGEMSATVKLLCPQFDGVGGGGEATNQIRVA